MFFSILLDKIKLINTIRSANCILCFLTKILWIRIIIDILKISVDLITRQTNLQGRVN